MKHDKMKRVLAATLSLLTVAGPMTANVGGIIKDVAIVAHAAGDTMVTWNENVQGLMTSMTDGTNSRNTTDIEGSIAFKFEADTVLTIESKVPLTFNDGVNIFNNTDLTDPTKTLPATTNLLEKDAQGAFKYINKYVVTEKTDGSYTYKVRVVVGLSIAGVTSQSVQFTNQTMAADASGLVRTDGSKIALTQLNSDVTVNGTANTDALDTAIAYANEFVKKGSVKLYAGKAFEVYIKDNEHPNAKLETATAVYDAKLNKFVAVVPIPDSDNVGVFLNKVSPKYTYSNPTGTKLVATATNAPQVTAASITATYEAKVKKLQTEGQGYKYDKVTDLANNATVPNASRVVLTFNNDTTHEITSCKNATEVNSFYTLKITKDGKELDNAATPFINATCAFEDLGNYPVNTTYQAVKTNDGQVVPNALNNGEGTSTLAFTQTGVYRVEYTVYTASTSTTGVVTYTPQTLIYNFTIAPKPLLNASNVRLTATGNNLSGNQAIKKVGVVNGVVQIEVSENWNNDIIRVTPTIFEDTKDAANLTVLASAFNAGGVAADGSPKSIIGTDYSSDLNVEKTLTIIYNNAEYSASDQVITLKWKLVAEKKAIKIETNDDYAPAGPLMKPGDNANTDPYLITPIDKIDILRESLLDTVTISNADAEDIQFQYVKNFGTTPDTDMLNYPEEGLPTAVGEYTVFFVYDDEIAASANVQVTDHGLYGVFSDAQLSYTYGQKAPSSDELTYVDVKGNVVADAAVKDAAISYKVAYKLTASECKKITNDGKVTLNNATVVGQNLTVYTVGNDKYVATATVADLANQTVPGYLNAGVYIATIEADNNVTRIGKAGYALMPSTYAVSVAKKQITADMIVFDAVNYDNGNTVYPGKGGGKGYTVIDTAVKDAQGQAYDLTGKTAIADNVTTAQNVGEYEIGVQVTDANCNYTGKVNAKWHVVKEGTYMPSLDFVDANTTIFNNGQIHFELKRPDNSQFESGVVKYGVILDKNGKLAAPKKDANGKYARRGHANAKNTVNEGAYAQVGEEEFEAARKALQVNNGFKMGNQGDKQKAETPLTYGANIQIVDVETGAWFRPYVIDGKGNIYYGDVIYVNLVQEATDALKLTMANSSPYSANHLSSTNDLSGIGVDIKTKEEAKANQSAEILKNKTWRQQVQSGYDETTNSYYVYGSYTLEGNNLVKESAVQGFGVVVDKKGVFSEPTNINGVTTGYTSDGKTTVAEGLKLGNGFIEGKAKKDSTTMDADEYGAMIEPYNTVTGVWVRAYVDLGKNANSNQNLIVYTDPVYITDVSSYYNGAFNIQVPTIAWNAADKLNTITFAPNTQVVPTGTFKRAGVIVDDTGMYLKKNADGDFIADNTANFADPDAYLAAYNEMLLGNGFIQGKKTAAQITTNNGFYFGTITPATFNLKNSGTRTNIPVVVRPYEVYALSNGNEVVIYGDVVVSADSGN